MIKRTIDWSGVKKAERIYWNTKGRGIRELGRNGWAKLRNMIQKLEEMPIRELHDLKPYGFEKLSHNLNGQYSMRYNQERRLVFFFKGKFDDDGCVVVITKFDGHYGEK